MIPAKKTGEKAPTTRGLSLAPGVFLINIFLASAFFLPRAFAIESDMFLSSMEILDVVYGPNDAKVFNEPLGIFYDKNFNSILVADKGNARVMILDADSGRELVSLTHWLQRNGEKIPGEPRSIVTDKKGNIYLTDCLSTTIDVFNLRGDFLESIDLSQRFGAKDEILNPAYLAIDEEENLYITLTKGEIMVLDPQGKLKKRFGKSGTGKGEFNVITGIYVDKEKKIYVTHMQAELALQVFDNKGDFVQGFGSHEVGWAGFSSPSGVVVTDDGSIWVADTIRQVVKKFAQDGVFIGYFGEYGTKPGSMLYPTSLSTDGKERIFVLEKIGKRYQIFKTKMETAKSLPTPPASEPQKNEEKKEEKNEKTKEEKKEEKVLTGKIFSVSQRVIGFFLSDKEGVTKGQTFFIKRNNQIIGKVIVTSRKKNIHLADIVDLKVSEVKATDSVATQ